MSEPIVKLDIIDGRSQQNYLNLNFTISSGQSEVLFLIHNPKTLSIEEWVNFSKALKSENLTSALTFSNYDGEIKIQTINGKTHFKMEKRGRCDGNITITVPNSCCIKCFEEITQLLSL